MGCSPPRRRFSAQGVVDTVCRWLARKPHCLSHMRQDKAPGLWVAEVLSILPSQGNLGSVEDQPQT